MTGALASGPHTLAGQLEDLSGKKTPIRVHFTVWSGAVASAPYVEKNMSLASATTVESSDAKVAATMPAGAWFDTGNGDWLVLRVEPQVAPSSALPTGWHAGGAEVDVTATWALAGTEQRWFDQPLEVLLRTADPGVAPATKQGTGWRVLEPVSRVQVSKRRRQVCRRQGAHNQRLHSRKHGRAFQR